MLQLATAAGAVLAAFAVSRYLANVLFWVAVAAGLVASLLLLGILVQQLAALTGRAVSLLSFQRAALSVFGLLLVIAPAELFLERRERGVHQATPGARRGMGASQALALAGRYGVTLPPEAAAAIERRAGVLTMPADWQIQPVSVPGAQSAQRWHGVLHVFDSTNLRRSAPFPPKTKGVLRLLVVGDSMTYGYGVDETYIYPTLLQQQLGRDYAVEVLNMGRCGWESADILRGLGESLAVLQPDFVFYGVVHNDFLPSGKGQYVSHDFEVPLPAWLKKYLVDHSRLARLVSDAYDAALRRSKLRKDFFDDILEDFEGYQKRFARDVAEMNRLVTEHGLPPMTAMILDQYPDLEGRGYRITKVAERYLKEAGIDVIETEEYYRRYSKTFFRVSLWEGHADELGHAIFASMIVPRLRDRPVLVPFRRTATLHADGR